MAKLMALYNFDIYFDNSSCDSFYLFSQQARNNINSNKPLIECLENLESISKILHFKYRGSFSSLEDDTLLTN